jgi:hypothetical protein
VSGNRERDPARRRSNDSQRAALLASNVLMPEAGCAFDHLWTTRVRASYRCPKSSSRCSRAGFLLGELQLRFVRERAVREGLRLRPSMDGARSRQLPLSKIVSMTILSNPLRGFSSFWDAVSLRSSGAPRGIRTLVPALRGLCPRPLDDGSV